ncbi:MAG TPA: zf-HC2 domain-containing protein [Gemmatimonadales bacterium]|nr:zf-HC2 domain-containing protein [Gemmatimonadales bacterium]
MSHVDDGTLHAYLDGELSPPEAQSIEAHVAQCPACRTRLEEERALITRAGELLAQATPPDRELPAFRSGDVKPPVRLWWQVRLPLAWAATIALALGIGTFWGERSSMPRARTPSHQETPDRAGQVAQNAPALDRLAAPERQSQRESRARQAAPSTPPPVGTLAEERKPMVARSMADSISMSDSTAYRGSTALNPRGVTSAEANRRVVAKAAAPAAVPRPEMVSLGDRGYALKGAQIGADSARLLLGRDPLVVPDLPIRGIYRAQMIGYSGMVIVEQALDSSTVIEVINGRASPVQLEAVVVSGAGVPRADSLEAAAPKPEPAPAAEKQKAERMAPDFFVDVRGPLSTDSLAALHRLLRPLRP